MRWAMCLVLLCASAYGALDLEKPTFVRTKEMNTFAAVTFPFGNNIATATKNNTHIQINIAKADSTDLVAQCAIPVEPGRNAISGILRAATNDDTIIIYGKTSTENVGEDKRIRFGGIKIKPFKDCEETPMAIASYQIPKDYRPLTPVILFNKGRFRVLHHQQQDCPACQFHRKDDSFEATHGATEGKPLDSFIMKLVRLPSGDNGYFYAYNYENDTGVVRYLNDDRTIIKEKYLDHTIDVADPVKDKTAVNVCYEQGVQEIFCGQLDEKLEFSPKAQLPLLDDHISLSSTVSSNPKGGLMASTLQAQLGKHQKYVVYSYDASGKLLKAMDFGDLDESKVGDVNSWFTEDGGLYCLHMVETETLGDLDAHEVIKCIDPK